MEDLVREVRSVLRGMWQHRFKALAVAWVVALVGVAVALRFPERYEASARLFVDTETFLKPLFAGLAIQPNVEQQVALVSRTLVSRPNAERILAASALEGDTERRGRDANVDALMRNLKLASLRENVYQITYRDTDPQRAARVVRAALDIFVETSVGGKKRETQASLKVIDEHVKRAEDALRATEDRLREFKTRHMSAGSGGGEYFGRVTETQMLVEQARNELAAAEQRRDTYRRDLAGIAWATPAEPSQRAASALDDLDTRIAQARKDLDGLQLRYTDRHPDVANGRRLLADLEAQRKTLAATVRERPSQGPSAAGGSAPERSLAYQQLRVALGDAEAAVAAARTRLANAESQYRAMRAKAQEMPQIEAEYAQLNRDYEIQKRQYESLLQRRDQAMLGVDVQDAGVPALRVVDPPRVAGKPVAPDRLMLLAAAFGAALAAGIGTAFVASRLRPTFHDARSLRQAIARPAIGIVTRLSTPAVVRARRRGAALFAGGLAMLVVSFAALGMLTLLLERAA